MNHIRSLAAAALTVSACGWPAAAQAFSCTASEGDECAFVKGPLLVVFEAGQYSFDGDSQLGGSDGWVTGYTVGTYEFPELTALDLGGGWFGFEFATPMSGSVGGSGFVGEHEAAASFRFESLRFEAAPGWRIDDLMFMVTGQARAVGDANVWLNLPGPPQFNGDGFTATGSLPLGSTGFGAGFSAWTIYEEDGDGGAASYGTAFARFDTVRLVAQVSAVPEPASAALWLMGLAVAWGGSRRRIGRSAKGHPAAGSPA